MSDLSRSKSVKDFLARLKHLKSDNYFYPRSKSHYFAEELEDLLLEINEIKSSPEEGIELLKLFFEADNKIIERCDDSSGYVGGVFRNSATELFGKYAQKCEDKDWLSKVFYELIIRNDYGLRDYLPEKGSVYLPERNIKEIVNKLWKLYLKNKSKLSPISSELTLIQIMAKRLKDPILFEKTIKEEGWLNIDFDNQRLGEMYYEFGDFKKAIFFFERISSPSDKILMQAYVNIGEKEKSQELALKIFRSERTLENFEIFLKNNHQKNYSEILQNELRIIHEERQLNEKDVDFLLQMKLFDEAESYILARRNFLDGRYYESYMDWIEHLEARQKFLAATLIYRALLDAILKSANSKAYTLGVRYLRKLEVIDKKISDWKGLQSHSQYFESIREIHGKKYSFWKKC